MDKKDFNESVNETFAKAKSLLIGKNEEYVAGVNALVIFEKSAHLQGIHPQEALLGMVSKQIVSLFEMSEHEMSQFTDERWEEKILDVINYMAILKAMSTEYRNNTQGGL